MLTDTDRAQMRADQEALMESTVTIRRGEGSWQFIDGQEVYVPGETIYSGKAKVQDLGGREQTTTMSGAGHVVTYDHVVVVPWSVAAVVPGDHATVDTSPDPLLVGRLLPVEGVSGSDFVTARRLLCLLNLDRP